MDEPKLEHAAIAAFTARIRLSSLFGPFASRCAPLAYLLLAVISWTRILLAKAKRKLTTI